MELAMFIINIKHSLQNNNYIQLNLYSLIMLYCMQRKILLFLIIKDLFFPNGKFNYFYKEILALMNKKYHQISIRSSESSAANLVQTIISNAQNKVFEKNIMTTYKAQMARQVVAAQSESIQQIRSSIPKAPFAVNEDLRPNRNVVDAIRPYSAKIERLKKINTCIQNNQASFSKRTSFFRNSQSMKSLKSAKNIIRNHRREQKSQLSKYKSRLIPLVNSFQQNQEADKIIQQLRKNKVKAEQYQKSKQCFLNSISKQNQLYTKRQAKFASTMSRKQYTYSYTGQIMEIQKQKKVIKKKSTTMKNTITGCQPKKGDEQNQKPQTIQVQFSKKEPRVQLKQYIFGNGVDCIATESLCPISTNTTKFTLVISQL